MILINDYHHSFSRESQVVRVFVFGALFLALTAWGFGVEVLGTLVVDVVNSSTDAPVAGASVKVFSSGSVVGESVTDASGRASFERLLTGDYRVEIAHTDYETQSSTVRVTPDAPVRFQALVLPKGEETVIRVVQDRLLVNRGSTAPVTRRDRQQLEQLPGNGSLQTVLGTTPGMQSNSMGQIHARGEHKSVSLSIDGLDIPIPMASSTSQIIDPRFLQSLDVQTGGYDASIGGQTGAVLNMVTLSRPEPFVQLSTWGGNVGQVGGLLLAGGANDDKTFDYFVGARVGRTDLRLEAPNPGNQTLNNTGTDENILLRLHGRTEDDDVGFTLVYQNGELGVPQTLQNFTAGVRQNQFDKNILALLSWNRKVSEEGDLHLGLSYLRSGQHVNNNGVFTPWVPLNPALGGELAEEGATANPGNPGSPYLPVTNLTLSQFQPSLEYKHKVGDGNIKVGATANFIHSNQFVDVIDAGGGGGLPNPDPTLPAPLRFTARAVRDGFSGGIYFTHTVPLSDEFTLNYGLRADRFNDGFTVDTGQISPSVNLAYGPSETQVFRASFNRLFQPPPLELDVSGGAAVLPQRVSAYELSYENQLDSNLVGKIALVDKEFTDQVDIGLLIPNSNLPVFAPVNFARARYRGLELSINTSNPVGWNGFGTLTVGTARPLAPAIQNGEFPEYNDHDQRVQTTAGLSYTWQEGWFAGGDIFYGSGYPQEFLPLYNALGYTPFGYSGDRFGRFLTNLRLGYQPRDENGKPTGGFGANVEVNNLFDDRTLLNFFSEFSGTRFVQGRRVLLNATYEW